MSMIVLKQINHAIFYDYSLRRKISGSSTQKCCLLLFVELLFLIEDAEKDRTKKYIHCNKHYNFVPDYVR